MQYKLSYGIFHWSIHLLSAFAFGYLLQLDFSNYLIVFASIVAIDIDHLNVALRHGVKGILKLAKINRSPFHRFYFLFLFLAISLVIYQQFLSLSLIFASFVLHMLWDLSEDALIFKLGVKRWW